MLDPVGVGATSLRNSTTQELTRRRPTVLRANASEILALGGRTSKATKGVDSTAPSVLALGAGRRLAQELKAVIVISGRVDCIIDVDGERVLEVHNGYQMMTRVTGLGCTASALGCAFLAVEPDPVLAATQAMVVLGIAGELAVKQSPGPGSLQLRLLDALYTLDQRALLRVHVR